MTENLSSSVQYREDINGLRAWAVMAVLLFHFSLIGIPGGFIGVDVFFVISGYLMTAIVIRGHEKEKFSFVQFYMSRLRRILPALLVVIAALVVLGWFWLPTIDYKVLGTQSLSAMAFISNVYYYSWTGYFDTSAHEKWLLHTWSLAVEAQFYILYPVILTIIWRLSRGDLKKVLISIACISMLSFFLNIYFVNRDASAAFYLLPMRGWELLFGGLVFLVNELQRISVRTAILSFWGGWAILFFSFFYIDSSMIWPGYLGLLPVVGTSLIILSNNKTSKITSNPLAHWLGERSYSLYLWHWPIVVGIYFGGYQNDWLIVSLAIILSFVFAHLSFKYVEKPARRLLSNIRFTNQVFVVGGIVLSLSLIVFTVRGESFNGRLPSNVETAASGSFDRNPRQNECLGTDKWNQNKSCLYGLEPVEVLFVGDSHADAVVTALEASSDGGVLAWAMRGCPILLGAKFLNKSQYDSCVNLPRNLLVNLASRKDLSGIPLVILTRASKYAVGDIDGVGSDKSENNKPTIYFTNPVESSDNKTYQSEYIDSVVKTACAFQENRQVYLVRPIPEIGVDVPRILSRNLMFGNGRDDIKLPIEEYHSRNALAWRAQDAATKACGVRILNPMPYLCDEKYCYATRNGKALYADDDHLSETGNKLLVPMFKKIFNSFYEG